MILSAIFSFGLDLGSDLIWARALASMQRAYFAKETSKFSQNETPGLFGVDLGRYLLYFLSLFASFPPCSQCCKAGFVAICVIPALFAVLQI